MGLDMYLDGRKYLWSCEAPQTEDGFEVKRKTLELGYWRKHPNLHGYIVQTFAEGVDDCRDIELDRDDLLKIIVAVKDKKLPHTEGFFFGESDGSEDEETLRILESAREWLQTKEPGVSRSVVYHASW